MHIHPFKKDIPVAVCETCGEVIYKGETAYLIEGGILCGSCVDAGEFIADDAESLSLPSVGDALCILQSMAEVTEA